MDIAITTAIGVDVLLGECVRGIEDLRFPRSEGGDGFAQAREWVGDENIVEGLIA